MLWHALTPLVDMHVEQPKPHGCVPHGLQVIYPNNKVKCISLTVQIHTRCPTIGTWRPAQPHETATHSSWHPVITARALRTSSTLQLACHSTHPQPHASSNRRAMFRLVLAMIIYPWSMLHFLSKGMNSAMQVWPVAMAGKSVLHKGRHLAGRNESGDSGDPGPGTALLPGLQRPDTVECLDRLAAGSPPATCHLWNTSRT
jgi:hypothetical protein